MYTFLLPAVVLLYLGLTSRRLIYGIYILLILMPYERAFVTKAYGLNIKMAEWAGLICVVFFLWNYLTRPQKKMFPSWVLRPILIFAFVNIVLGLLDLPQVMKFTETLNFNSPGFRTIKVVSWCVFSILIAMATCYSIRDARDLRNAIGFLLTSTLILCALSLVAMICNVAGISFATWTLIGRSGFVGVKGPFSEPQYFALYLAAIVPIALVVFILRVYRVGTLLTILGSFALLLANYFSFSTTGLAGVTVMIVAIPFLIKHYRLVTTSKGMRFMIIIVLSIYIIFLVGVFSNVDFIKVTIANYFDKLAKQDSRWAGRVMGEKIFKDHPLVGVGPGNWEWIASQKGYGWRVEKETFVRPSYNCLYWEILADLGLAGMIPFVWFFFSLFRALSKGVWRTNDLFLKALSLGLMLGIAVLLGEYYVTFNFYRIHVWPIFGIALATIRLSFQSGVHRR
ncbi:MAG: O-antigen ligase family protein [Candidatus Omnitrophota bacterium]